MKWRRFSGSYVFGRMPYGLRFLPYESNQKCIRDVLLAGTVCDPWVRVELTTREILPAQVLVADSSSVRHDSLHG